MNSKNIQLKTVEEFRHDQAQDCLPKGVRAMVVGERVVFLKWHITAQRWLPVNENLQRQLEEKHIIKK